MLECELSGKRWEIFSNKVTSSTDCKMKRARAETFFGLCFVFVNLVGYPVTGLDNQNTLRYDGEVNIGKIQELNLLRSLMPVIKISLFRPLLLSVILVDRICL